MEKIKSIILQRQKIEIATFLVLFHSEDKTPSAAQAFNAYVAAEQGDYSGLALLNLLYDMTFPLIGIWGDRLLKGVTADFDPSRDYLADMYDEQRFYNSPLSAFLWGLAEVSEYDWPQLPEEFRGLKPSSVETLMISGNVDFSTPSELATEGMLPVLSSGKQVILKEFGHVNDIYNLQPEAFHHLALNYFQDGSADDSLFEYEPMDFSPSITFQTILERTLGVIIGFPILIIAMIAGLVLRRRGKRSLRQNAEDIV